MSAGARQDWLSKAAHDRLYPSLTNPNFGVLRSRRLIFQRWIGHLARSGLRVLDIGGRYQPYRPLFEEHVDQYIACDLLRTELVDVIASGEMLPFARSSFDVVIATQVFEYFREPIRAAGEIYGVLKPGGVLLMSVAAVAPRFVDEECWRFTPAGIHATLSQFGTLEIAPEVSSVGGLLRTVNLGLHAFMRHRWARSAYELTICPSLNLLALALESLNLSNNDQFTPNYSVLAVK